MEIDSMTEIITAMCAITAVFLEVMCLIAGAVWVVNKIHATTASLSSEIKHLTEAVQALNNDINSIHSDVSSLKERVAVVESRGNK